MDPDNDGLFLGGASQEDITDTVYWETSNIHHHQQLSSSSTVSRSGTATELGLRNNQVNSTNINQTTPYHSQSNLNRGRYVKNIWN